MEPPPPEEAQPEEAQPEEAQPLAQPEEAQPEGAQPPAQPPPASESNRLQRPALGLERARGQRTSAPFPSWKRPVLALALLLALIGFLGAAPLRWVDPSLAIAVSISRIGAGGQQASGDLVPLGSDPWGQAYSAAGADPHDPLALPSAGEVYRSYGPDGKAASGDEVVLDSAFTIRYRIGELGLAGGIASLLDLCYLFALLLVYLAFVGSEGPEPGSLGRDLFHAARRAYPPAFVLGILAWVWLEDAGLSPLVMAYGQLEHLVLVPRPLAIGCSVYALFFAAELLHRLWLGKREAA